MINSQLSQVNRNLQEKRSYTYSMNERRDNESGVVVGSPASILPADNKFVNVAVGEQDG